MRRMSSPSASNQRMLLLLLGVISCTSFEISPLPSHQLRRRCNSLRSIPPSFTSRVAPITERKKIYPISRKWTLNAKNGDNEEEKPKNSLFQPFTDSITKLNDLIQSILSKFNDLLPDPIKLILMNIKKQLPNIRLAVLSFITGGIICVAAILVPIYNEVDRYEQPVTLFETILSDLDKGYVDEVNTKKLFETGVSAMLRSLDPYTEYYEKLDEMQETVTGRYAGVGLVISGSSDEALKLDNVEENVDDDDDDDDVDAPVASITSPKPKKKVDRGIKVVSAFEGYAFDYGMRVGDRLVAVDSISTKDKTVEGVRNMLRGAPGTQVAITFLRDGVEGEQTVYIPRNVVKIPDVKCATLIGTKDSPVGYIQLKAFSDDAGKEVRNSILNLQAKAMELKSDGLQGIVLDLRNNPGGLLTSAVDVSSIFVPKNSEIVSARGRGFPGVLYRSRVDPLVPPTMKTVVLTNGQTASAAEIVSGAIQDLDTGVIIGTGRTYGKGLVQNVEQLPFQTALKFTVAKYYTPSGRCIQSTNYKEGGGLKAEEASFSSSKVKDHAVYYTKGGREVKDGGGVEADIKIAMPKASVLEVTLLRSGAFADYASEWSKKYELKDNFEVTDDMYKEFVHFVDNKAKEGDIQLEAIYSRNIDELQKILKKSGYKGSELELDTLRATILRDIQKDFQKYKNDIKEDIEQNILARYVPERMLIERGVKKDKQVDAALKLIADSSGKFDRLLARDVTTQEMNNGGKGLASTASSSSSMNTAVIEVEGAEKNQVKFNVRF